MTKEAVRKQESTILTERQAAEHLSVSMKTLQSWRQKRRGPAYVRMGTRAIRYALPDLENFVAGNRIELRRGEANHGK